MFWSLLLPLSPRQIRGLNLRFKIKFVFAGLFRSDAGWDHDFTWEFSFSLLCHKYTTMELWLSIYTPWFLSIYTLLFFFIFWPKNIIFKENWIYFLMSEMTLEHKRNEHYNVFSSRNTVTIVEKFCIRMLFPSAMLFVFWVRLKCIVQLLYED